MSAMFSQNPLMNGPNYSFNQAPATASASNKEHGFYPYVALSIVFSLPAEIFHLDTLITGAQLLPSLAPTLRFLPVILARLRGTT